MSSLTVAGLTWPWAHLIVLSLQWLTHNSSDIATESTAFVARCFPLIWVSCLELAQKRHQLQFDVLSDPIEEVLGDGTLIHDNELVLADQTVNQVIRLHLVTDVVLGILG